MTERLWPGEKMWDRERIAAGGGAEKMDGASSFSCAGCKYSPGLSSLQAVSTACTRHSSMAVPVIKALSSERGKIEVEWSRTALDGLTLSPHPLKPKGCGTQEVLAL
jgi:hypothetical protein